MAKNRDHLADSLDAEDRGGWLAGFLAEEDEVDRRLLWRLGTWAVVAIGAVTLAVLASQASVGWRHDQVSSADLTRQAQQIHTLAKESQNEARRLASAIETLNSDRDRLFSRVNTLEQGLDSVTGAITRQNTVAVAPPPVPAAPVAAPFTASEPAAVPHALPHTPPPAVAPVATTQPAPAPAAVEPPAQPEKPAVAADTGPTKAAPTAPVSDKAPVPDNAPTLTPSTPLIASQSIMAPPDPSAGKLIEPAKPASAVTASPMPDVVAAAPTNAEPDEASAPKASIQRTEFGVDLGAANSVAGLRALWGGLLKSKSSEALADLRPIIVVKESTNGLGMQLRLVAGPLNDAGAAARICAVLTENKRPCETTLFDGQRLTLKVDEPAKPAPRRAPVPKRPAAEESKKPEASTLSTLFGRKSAQ